MARTILKHEDQSRYIFNPADFPFEMDGIIYYRQSTLYQREHNIHSLEMQTNKFIEHFRNKGCTGHIELIPDDEVSSASA